MGVEIFMMGDLNDRIGEKNYFVENNDLNAQDDYLPIPDDFEVNTNIRKRKPLNNIEVSGHHKQLLNFCKATGLKILNGRVGDDREMGNFTCHTSAGSSTVDYCLTRERNFDHVENFYVGEINTISDHAYLQLRLKINISEATETNVLEDESQIKKIMSFLVLKKAIIVNTFQWKILTKKSKIVSTQRKLKGT